MIIFKRYLMIIVVFALGLSLLGYQLWYDNKHIQPGISTKTEGEITEVKPKLSENLKVPSSQSDQYTPVGDINFPDGKNDKKSKLSQAERLDRLIKLDSKIDQKNDEFARLIKEYNKDLSNKQNQNKLSSALQNSEAYKSNILDKFKIENDKIFAEN